MTLSVPPSASSSLSFWDQFWSQLHQSSLLLRAVQDNIYPYDVALQDNRPAQWIHSNHALHRHKLYWEWDAPWVLCDFASKDVSNWVLNPLPVNAAEEILHHWEKKGWSPWSNSNDGLAFVEKAVRWRWPSTLLRWMHRCDAPSWEQLLTHPVPTTQVLSHQFDAGNTHIPLLHWWVMSNQVDVVAQAIERYPSLLSVTDSVGRTLAFYAVSEAMVALLRPLCDWGHQDHRGKTAEHYWLRRTTCFLDSNTSSKNEIHPLQHCGAGQNLTQHPDFVFRLRLARYGDALPNPSELLRQDLQMLLPAMGADELLVMKGPWNGWQESMSVSERAAVFWETLRCFPPQELSVLMEKVKSNGWSPFPGVRSSWEQMASIVMRCVFPNEGRSSGHAQKQHMVFKDSIQAFLKNCSLEEKNLPIVQWLDWISHPKPVLSSFPQRTALEWIAILDAGLQLWMSVPPYAKSRIGRMVESLLPCPGLVEALLSTHASSLPRVCRQLVAVWRDHGRLRNKNPLSADTLSWLSTLCPNSFHGVILAYAGTLMRGSSQDELDAFERRLLQPYESSPSLLQGMLKTFPDHQGSSLIKNWYTKHKKKMGHALDVELTVFEAKQRLLEAVPFVRNDDGLSLPKRRL